MESNIDFIASLLKSDDYIKRFKGEYYLLRDKHDKLQKMLYKERWNKLNFTPTCPVELLCEQEECMRRYMAILEQRAVIEEIEL